MKRAILWMSVVAAPLAAPVPASADGLPVTGVDGADGVLSANGASRFVTFTGRSATTVVRIRTRGGTIGRHRALAGRWSVPVVALDGTGDGLSADGRTLVLIRPRAGLAQQRTRFAILDPGRRLELRRRITLAGDFSFDAVSPDGSTVYLIEYLSLSRRNFDPTDYRVRALDAGSGRLLPGQIADPREPGERMAGFPIARQSSPDGRWAYTLYGGGEHAFVHALDTTGRTARCIDLDGLSKRQDLFQLRLELAADGRRLDVIDDARPVVAVDTRSFAVSEPRAVRAAAPAPPSESGGRPLWPLAAAAGVLVLLLAGASARPLARAGRSR